MQKKYMFSFWVSLFVGVIIFVPLQAVAEVDLASKIVAQQTDIQYLREQLAELRTVSDDLRQKVQALESEVAVLQKNILTTKGIRSEDATNTDVYRNDPVPIDKTRSGVVKAETLAGEIPLTSSKKTTSIQQPAISVLSPEEQAYEDARVEFEAEKYAIARTSFSEFLKKYPKSKLANNAGFWIGETYYREKNYDKAIASYRQVIEQYPEGAKVPASLLKMGMSFQQLGDLKKAKILFTTLIEEYPKSPEATNAKQRLDAMSH